MPQIKWPIAPEDFDSIEKNLEKVLNIISCDIAFLEDGITQPEHYEQLAKLHRLMSNIAVRSDRYVKVIESMRNASQQMKHSNLSKDLPENAHHD